MLELLSGTLHLPCLLYFVDEVVKVLHVAGLHVVIYQNSEIINGRVDQLLVHLGSNQF